MFTTFYPPYSFGGDAVGVQRMAQALAERGHHVTVVHDEDAYLTLGGKDPGKSVTNDGVRTIGLRSRVGFLSNLLTQQTGSPVLHDRQISEIVAEGFDITWYNNISLVGGPGLLDYGDGLRVYEAHEHWLVCPTHVLWKFNRETCEERACLRCVLNHRRPPQLWRFSGKLDRKLDTLDLIVAKSEFSRDKHRDFGLKQDMEVLPYFLPDIDAKEASETSPHDRPYFLFVGRLEKIKGLQDVFPAFDDYPDADLLILGDGDYSDTLRELAKDNDRIKFLGRKSLDELNEYYRHAVGLIVPSVCFETFGIILIESFRLGTPVIARRLGPFPEIVEQSGGGRLFETESDLTSAMHDLQFQKGLRDDLSRAARKAFEDIWREDQVLARFGRTFERAARAAGKLELADRLATGLLENGV